MEVNGEAPIEGPLGAYVSLTSSSDGPGYWEETYPRYPGGTTVWLYDGPDYYAGETACDQSMEEYNDAAWARFLEVMDTASSDEEGTASITATIRVQDVGELVGGTLTQIGEQLFTNGESLLIGCEEPPCNPEVSLSISSCGMQITVANGSNLNYEFVGKPGCISISLTVNGEETTIAGIPLMRLDGNFNGEANPVVGGGGIQI